MPIKKHLLKLIVSSLTLLWTVTALAEPIYLNETNITVDQGPATSPGDFNNTFDNGNTINKVIDAPTANTDEIHNQSTHIWFTADQAGGGLELVFDFGQEYDVTTLHFWNYNRESFDVDTINFTFLNSRNIEVGSLSIEPDLGSTPAISAQDIPLAAPLNVQIVKAFLVGSNRQVDFQNIGFTAELSELSVPTLSISDVSAIESAGIATLTVPLSEASNSPVSVTVTSLDGTAQAPIDFTAYSNDILFAPGETVKQVIINIINDDISENEETFFVQLSNSQNATIASDKGTVTIIDDDQTSSVSSVFTRVAELLEQNDPITKTVINDIAATVSSEFGINLDPRWVAIVNRFGASGAAGLQDRLDAYKARAGNYFVARRRAEENGKSLTVWKQRHKELISVRARRALSSTEAARLRTAKTEISKRTRLQTHWKSLRDRHNRILENNLPEFQLDGARISFPLQRNLAALL